MELFWIERQRYERRDKMIFNFDVAELMNRNYVRLYSIKEDLIFGHKTVQIDVDDKRWTSFMGWLINKFSFERINKKDKSLVGKTVLRVSIDKILSEEEYFEIDGKLYEIYRDNKIQNLYSDFIHETTNE